MVQALVLGNVAFSFPKELKNELMNIPEVNDANLIYGSHDFYVILKAEKEKELMEAITQIRGIDGVQSIMTCKVVNPLFPTGFVKE